MAKIECSVTVNFFKEWWRMCNAHSCGCGCPVFGACQKENVSCATYMGQHPDIAIEIVQAWSDEHPVKTRLDDLLERCPNVPLDGKGFPCFTPSMLGYCGDCNRCRNWKNPDVRNCWNEPVDGGATGKAVE